MNENEPRNIQKIHIDIILDLDMIEEIEKNENPHSTYDRYFNIGLGKALCRIKKEADRGMSDYSTDSAGGFGGGYWKIKPDGIQIRWEIDYPRYIDWSDSDDDL